MGQAALGILGAGSDHVSFVCSGGGPSCTLGGGGYKGWSYHSAYDSLPWYWKSVGADYASALMVTRMTNAVASRLANALRCCRWTRCGSGLTRGTSSRQLDEEGGGEWVYQNGPAHYCARTGEAGGGRRWSLSAGGQGDGCCAVNAAEKDGKLSRGSVGVDQPAFAASRSGVAG